MDARTIRVTGKGFLRVKPDMVRITMTLEDVKREYDKALEASAEDSTVLKDLLKMEGFESSDVKTVSFSVDTEEESYKDKHGNWKSKFIGYKYRHVMKVEFPMDNDRLGQILYLIANNAAVRPEFRFSFFVKDEEASKNELLGKAVEDAKEKAHVLADAAGVELGDIVTVDYSWGTIDFEVQPIGNLSLMAGASYKMDLEPDDIDMSDTVTIIWKIA